MSNMSNMPKQSQRLLEDKKQDEYSDYDATNQFASVSLVLQYAMPKQVLQVLVAAVLECPPVEPSINDWVERAFDRLSTGGDLDKYCKVHKYTIDDVVMNHIVYFTVDIGSDIGSNIGAE